MQIRCMFMDCHMSRYVCSWCLYVCANVWAYCVLGVCKCVRARDCVPLTHSNYSHSLTHSLASHTHLTHSTSLVSHTPHPHLRCRRRQRRSLSRVVCACLCTYDILSTPNTCTRHCHRVAPKRKVSATLVSVCVRACVCARVCVCGCAFVPLAYFSLFSVFWPQPPASIHASSCGTLTRVRVAPSLCLH